MAHSIGWRQLVAAGFKVDKAWGGKWYKVVAPDGTHGHVLRQSRYKWHFFYDEVEATGSGSTPEKSLVGDLGDVIGTDGELRSYKKMLLECPEPVLHNCAAACRASSDVYNERR